MDWKLVIEKNRDALLGVLVHLFALAGLSGATKPSNLSRHAHRAILRLLRPAESALRRLIIIAARDMKRPSFPRGATQLPDFSQFDAKNAETLPRFRLIDPRKRFGSVTCRPIAKTPPRISVPGICDPEFAPVIDVRPEDQVVDAKNIAQRLNAMQIALDDLPRQARRLVRYEALLLKPVDDRPVRLSPIRPGLPPGYRKRRLHAVDDILFETDLLARDPAPFVQARGPTVHALHE